MNKTFQLRNIIQTKGLQQFTKFIKNNKLTRQELLHAIKAANDIFKPVGLIPYLEAIKSVDQKIVQEKIVIDEENQVTILMKICEVGTKQSVQKMLDLKLPLNQLDKLKRNCLFYAIQNKKQGEEIINYILSKFPNYIEKSIDQQGYSLLHQAIYLKNYPIALFILKKDKINPNLQTKYEKASPMHLLFYKIDKNEKNMISNVLQALLNIGADPNIKDQKGYTPIQKVKDEGLKQTFKKIIATYQRAKSGKKQTQKNSKDYNKTKGKSEFGRDLLKQHNEVLKSGMNSKNSPLIIIQGKQDQVQLNKQASRIYQNHVQEKDNLMKINKMQLNKKKKEQKNRIMTPDELKYYLQQDINLTVQNIQKINHQYKNSHQELIQKVKKQLTSSLSINVQIFGSYATGLCLPESDIDIVIIPKQDYNENPVLVLKSAKQILQQMVDQIAFIKLIKTATVPIIKLQCTQKYKGKKIDISYKDQNHNGLIAVQLIKKYLGHYKNLKPLAFILKKFIYTAKLFDPYSGGISSYGLILMIVAFIQHETQRRKQHQKQPPMTSQLLIGFLRFYGYQMDYILKCLYVQDPQRLQNNNIKYTGCIQPPQYQQYRDLTPKLIIIDPLKQMNNVGRATHKIKQIKMFFEIAYVCIHTNMYCGKKKNCESYMRIKECKVDQRYHLNVRPCCILARMFKSTDLFSRAQ